MKKYGKYEKMPDGTRAKQPPVKSMLLQTYFTSLLCLVLCVTMFFGTSYAWFTSEVNNTNNEIYIGTLDVELEKQVGEKWKSLSELTDGVNTTKLFDNNIRWEPGYTALETIKVVNEGDLAFKYVLNFTDGKAQKVDNNEANLADVAKFFDVWVYDHRANASKTDAVADPGSYAELTAENSGWVSAGSLDELLAGKAVLDGVMVTVRQDDKADDPTTPNETDDGVATEDTYTIALHMKEEATAAVMGQRITLNVKLIAYQMASEQDSLGGKYDQMVATEEQLREALANGGRVALATDIKLTEGLTVASGKTVILDLNRHTISQEKECTDSYAMISNDGYLTITGNGKLSFTDTSAGDSTFGWGSYTIRNSGTLVVENGTVEHLGSQAFAKHCIQAIFQYSGSTTINGGNISTPNYRSIRLWHGDMIINGGVMDGQVWVQTQTGESAALTINGGSFSPNGNDKSSVFLENGTNTVTFSVTAGEFKTKIGATKPEDLAGSISGGVFIDNAKTDTDGRLFAATFED